MNTNGNPAMHSKKDKRDPRPTTNTSLPAKDVADAAAPSVAASRTSTQRGRVKSESAPATRSTGRRGRLKEEFVRRPAQRAGKRGAEMPEMEPPRRRRGAAVAPDTESGYLVLRVRLTGERLRVIDSRLMPGPLVADQALAGSHAYEVTVGGRLVHTGSLPDLGVQRSFANPEATEGVETGHHLAERRTVDFTVRVPAGQVTAETQADVDVVLLRVKNEVRIDRLDDEPVSARFERDLRPVARLSGLPDDALPDSIRERGNPSARA